MSLKIATWNINSVRLRAGLVERYVQEHQPDILCLQETKCRDSEFPSGVFKSMGFDHLAINGQKGYHGVAIASRLPILDMDKRDFCGMGDARHVSVRVKVSFLGEIPLTIHNFYVPAGGDEPDRQINPKFGHKLDFLDEMTSWFASCKLVEAPAILVGDLNVAPLETDVWSHKALLSVVSHTPIEVAKMGLLQKSGPWIDAVREKFPADQKIYSWWSYRSPNWEIADKGRRLDHIWMTPPAAKHLQAVSIHKAARGWERPSDHVPSMVSLA